MKKILIIISFLFVWNFAHAQERGFVVSFSYDNYIGEDAGSGKLLGIRVNYEQMKELFGRSGSWRSGFQFSSGDYSNTYTAVKKPNNYSQLLPNQIEVSGITDYKSLQFEVTQKLYFGNGSFQYGGIYLLFGVGFNVVKHETTYNYFTNNRLYYSIKDGEEGDETEKTVYQLTTNIGVGYEFHFEYFNLFIESDLNTPIFAAQDFDPTEFQFDDRGHSFYGISLGVRINLP